MAEIEGEDLRRFSILLTSFVRLTNKWISDGALSLTHKNGESNGN
jgi:hypothetical protein